MKTKQRLAPFVMFCTVAALVGCASTNRHVSASSFDQKNVQPAEAPSSNGLSQRVFLDERAFGKLDLNADRTVTLAEWQDYDTSAGAKDNFSALDENGDGQINVTEFLRQAPKHSERYHFFGDKDKTNDSHVSWDNEVFQQPGLQLFSIHF